MLLSTWEGVTVNAEGRVIALDLSSLMSSYDYHVMAWGEVLKLAALEELYLDNIDLRSDEIPAGLGSLVNLRVLDLRRNNFHGRLPIELGNLVNLETFLISGNDSLWGCLPTGFADIPEKDLDHSSVDHITFCVDVAGRERLALAALFNATDGPNWEGNDNWLSDAPLSEWFGVTTEFYGSVIGLDLGWIGLNGELPEELGNLENLETLLLTGNDLSGCVPGALISGLHKLEQHDLFELGIPICQDAYLEEREALAAILRAFDREEEIIDGVRRSSLYKGVTGVTGVTVDEDGWITGIDFGHEEVGGEIPPELGDLSNLTYLDLGDNEITGSVPVELAKLTKLTYLDLGSNELTGGVPVELSKLSALTHLILGSNDLSGSIPPELGSLSNLTDLELSYIGLSGSIPPELGMLSNLEVLSLSYNQLSGDIPAALGNLSSLTYLSLSDNQLTGEIPPELGRLTDLGRLYLNRNQLSGPIPEELANLPSLRDLYLGDNNLSCVPRNLARQFQDNLELYIGDLPAC